METSAPAVLQARDVTKIYRNGALQVQALRGVSFDILPGEFIVAAQALEVVGLRERLDLPGDTTPQWPLLRVADSSYRWNSG